ncbi:MAG TPA: PstS family phosphate ABC transporter substrate-binding protein [Thermomicrobiales bacterium]|nr:PstS family phosphate ABC transporter substrate-binding protein [Thermomicrobiales bacterium]
MIQQGTWKRLIVMVAILMLGSLVLVACGDDDEDADPTSTTGAAAATNTTGTAAGATEPAQGGSGEPVDLGDLSGEINVDGSSTVFPAAQAFSEDFIAMAPDVRFSVNASGTGGGFEKFCADETDISNASRPISEEEIALCEQNGVDYTEFQVGVDGLSVVVNIENDWVECVTVEQLNMIWGQDSTVTNWSDVDSTWPDEPIDLYGPGTDSGTFDYFTGEINGEEGNSRADYTASEDDNVLVQGIAGNQHAMGYFGYAYYVENQDTLKVLAVDGGEGCVEPNPETVSSGEYAPLSRPLFMYASNASLAEKPEVAAFFGFILSEDGQAIVPEIGYVSLSDEQLATEQAELESALP